MDTKRLIKAKYILDNEGAIALVSKASHSDLMTEKIVKGLWGLETDLSNMHQRYAEGKDWDETYMYGIAVEKFANDERVWRSKTIDELRDRFARIDRVYEDMRSSGYKTQLEMYQDGERSLEEVTKYLCGYQAPNEPHIAIDRNGELIRSTHGKHRLAIARALEIDRKVPVIVQLEHQKWDKTINAKREPLADHPLFYKDGSDE